MRGGVAVGSDIALDDTLQPPLFSVPGCRVVYEYSIQSTNTLAHNLARNGAEERIIVVAEEQSAGKGRRGRGWVSGVGGAMFSLILRPSFSIWMARRIPLVASVAAVEACEDVCGIKPWVKWPNDLLIKGKKVSGILAESSAEEERILYTVVGIGINAAQTADDFPAELWDTATSLTIEAGRPVKRSDVIQAFARRFFVWYDLMGAESDDAFWRAFEPVYRTCSITLGRRVTIVQTDGSFEAVAERLGESGELWVKMDDGWERAVWAADVSVKM